MKKKTTEDSLKKDLHKKFVEVIKRSLDEQGAIYTLGLLAMWSHIVHETVKDEGKKARAKDE